ncbi:hypothetical protein [Bradyrhizobium japonicum]|uniref:hypothetical protein n=1 Tax=Bradyrhizobium japonicum TaxID=375 RepID=UPI0004808CE2
MSTQASDLARRLAERAELVCRRYLSNGRRVGRYWVVGDARNAPGRSMFVRLRPRNGGKGAAGKWTDYVAAKIMLRLGAEALSHSRLAISTQHNVVLREVV